MREPGVVVSSGGYYTMLELAPEVDPARRSVLGPVTSYGAFPAFGTPGVPAPGMVPAPMMASAPVKVRAPSGAEAWSMGLLALLMFVPGFNVLFAANRSNTKNYFSTFTPDSRNSTRILWQTNI